jgi:hypothetical protein
LRRLGTRIFFYRKEPSQISGLKSSQRPPSECALSAASTNAMPARPPRPSAPTAPEDRAPRSPVAPPGRRYNRGRVSKTPRSGDWPRSNLEAPGREHWPDEGGHVAELPILATRNVVGERREWSRRDERPFSGERNVSDVDEVEAVIASLR